MESFLIKFLTPAMVKMLLEAILNKLLKHPTEGIDDEDAKRMLNAISQSKANSIPEDAFCGILGDTLGDAPASNNS